MEEVTFDGLVLLRDEGRVMTPRATSEQLVAESRRRLTGRGHRRIADVGTGSGAIAIAVASVCPEVEVWATDTSAAAVLLARTNAHRHGLASRIFIRQGDLLDPVPAPLDLIVANLPYLPAATAADHPDLWREPADAVFAAGDGLGPYRRLIDAASSWLTADGVLLLQLDRHILTVEQSDLQSLRAGLDHASWAVDRFAAAMNPVRCSHLRLVAARRSSSHRTLNPKVAGSIRAPCAACRQRLHRDRRGSHLEEH